MKNFLKRSNFLLMFFLMRKQLLWAMDANLSYQSVTIQTLAILKKMSKLGQLLTQGEKLPYENQDCSDSSSLDEKSSFSFEDKISSDNPYYYTLAFDDSIRKLCDFNRRGKGSLHESHHYGKNYTLLVILLLIMQ